LGRPFFSSFGVPGSVLLHVFAEVLERLSDLAARAPQPLPDGALGALLGALLLELLVAADDARGFLDATLEILTLPSRSSRFMTVL